MGAGPPGGEPTDPESRSRSARSPSFGSSRRRARWRSRQALNLGHTVGHAIETVTGYARYRHGEAVGLGLLAALRLSGQDGLREEVAELLRRSGLPTSLDDTDPHEIVLATERDKKRLG